MDYRHLRIWGKMMVRYPPQIRADLDRARCEHAPDDAVLHNGARWVTYSEITRPDTRRIMDGLLVGLD